jgi:hypothetical protein
MEVTSLKENLKETVSQHLSIVENIYSLLEILTISLIQLLWKPITKRKKD